VSRRHSWSGSSSARAQRYLKARLADDHIYINVHHSPGDPEAREALRRCIEILAAWEGTGREALIPLAMDRVVGELLNPLEIEQVAKRVSYTLTALATIAAGGVVAQAEQQGVTYADALKGIRRLEERKLDEKSGGEGL
jgi:hypothetical protein